MPLISFFFVMKYHLLIHFTKRTWKSELNVLTLNCRTTAHWQRVGGVKSVSSPHVAARQLQVKFLV